MLLTTRTSCLALFSAEEIGGLHEPVAVPGKLDIVGQAYRTDMRGYSQEKPRRAPGGDKIGQAVELSKSRGIANGHIIQAQERRRGEKISHRLLEKRHPAFPLLNQGFSTQ